MLTEVSVLTDPMLFWIVSTLSGFHFPLSRFFRLIDFCSSIVTLRYINQIPESKFLGLWICTGSAHSYAHFDAENGAGGALEGAARWFVKFP